MKKSILLCIGIVTIGMFPCRLAAQDFLKNAQVTGSFQADAALYQTDAAMGITSQSLNGQPIRMNGYTEVNYEYKSFYAGLRFEAYLPPLLGYDAQYQGAGVPYWYVKYKNDLLEITAGNFYEQFAQGMTFRTYQDWTLGYDNSMRGLRVKFMPSKGITLTGVYGFQRTFWIPYQNNNRGIVKGIDGDFSLNEMFNALANAKLKITLGGSFVSDYQAGKTMIYPVGDKVYTFNLPENVACYGGRLNLNYAGVNFYSEYAHKINDPSQMNVYIYKPGNSILFDLSYSRKNFGVEVKSKWIDNFSYKSNRSYTINGLDINYLPAINKEHTYALASMYPYATQTTGEVGIAAGVMYTIPKNTRLGGKNGLTIAVDFSQVNSIKKTPVNDTTPIGQSGTLGYATNFYSIGNEVYWQETQVEISKKFGKKVKGIFDYLYQTYNKAVVQGHPEDPLIYSNIGIADVTFNVNKKLSLRWELQGLWTKQDNGNWAAGLMEITISPKWFFSVSDQWNYGNSDASKQLHYYKGTSKNYFF
ncbi:MAG: DUF6029 family protein [Bacteroidetes bacterium]|nr:DUF6029 family protein [Bacteroidota bacterium]